MAVTSGNSRLRRFRMGVLCPLIWSRSIGTQDITPDFCSVPSRATASRGSSGWILSAFSGSSPSPPPTFISVLHPEAPTFPTSPLRSLQVLRLPFCLQLSLGLLWVASQSFLSSACSAAGPGPEWVSDENPLDASPL